MRGSWRLEPRACCKGGGKALGSEFATGEASQALVCLWAAAPFLSSENHGDVVQEVLSVGAALGPAVIVCHSPGAHGVTQACGTRASGGPSCTPGLACEG